MVELEPGDEAKRTRGSTDLELERCRISVLGPGLLGGSLALALRERGVGRELRVWARSEAAVAELQALGFSGAQVSSDLETVTRDADFLILATPVGAMRDLLETVLEAGWFAEGAVVTDVGSVKVRVVEALDPLAKAHGAVFVGAHPMAGSERTGLAAARADLFEGARCLVTPLPETPREAVDLVVALWSRLGSRTAEVSPERHDEVVARISHLPHAAAALVTVAALAGDPDRADFCGNGFRDTTRVASGAPEMWAEILLENRDAVLAALVDLRGNLAELLEFLEKRDHERLASLLREAKGLRDRF